MKLSLENNKQREQNTLKHLTSNTKSYTILKNPSFWFVWYATRNSMGEVGADVGRLPNQPIRSCIIEIILGEQSEMATSDAV